MADRYCRNCGQELTEDSRFCHSCGTPVHEAAHVPTPEADVLIPPPPRQPWDTTSATPQPAQTAYSSDFRLRPLEQNSSSRAVAYLRRICWPPHTTGPVRRER